MGGGNGPPWFTPDFPSLAAKRDPFPDVERWQSTYVRYALSDEAQPNGWDAESCRRNLRNVGRHEHHMLCHPNLPESISMRIVEAPAEFALPVKQDRRLLPCFKVRLEVKHRSAVTMPVTLRAHVLTQQDKEHVASWTPPEDGSTDGQKAVTELKGTAVIRGVLEAGDSCSSGSPSGDPKKGAAARDAFGFSSQTIAQHPMGTCNGSGMRTGDRPIKVEPAFSFGTSANGASFVGTGGAGAGLPGQRGFGAGAGACASAPLNEQAQQLLDSYNLVDSPGLSSNGPTREYGTGLLRELSGPPVVPPRDINLSSLFAPNRPDPVVTLASSGRLSGTGSSLPSFSSGLACGGGGAGSVQQPPGLVGAGGGGGLRNPGDSFEAAVEMLMQPSHAQQRRASPLHGGLMDGGAGMGGTGGSLLGDLGRGPMLSGMPRSQLPQQADEGQGQVQRGPGTPLTQAGCSSGTSAGGESGKMVTTTQDFEFTNLEFLKPTRMNKVYMAFTASIMDTDMLFVVFNVPTIGICRAEQREKACKKLNIDYKLLSHFDQGAERPPVSAASLILRGLNGLAAAEPGAATSLGGRPMPQLEPNKPVMQMPHQETQTQVQMQQQQQLMQHRSGQAQMADLKLSQLPGGASSQLMGSGRLGQRPDAKALPQPPSDVDFPRLASGMPHMGMSGPGMMGGNGMSAGGMPGGGMGAGGMMPGGGMGMPGMAPQGGISVPGMPGGGSSMGGGMPGGMACDINNSGMDFYFGNGASLASGGGMAPGMAGMEFTMQSMLGNSRKRDQSQKEDDNCRFQPSPAPVELPPYQGFMGLTSSDVEMLLPAPHSRMAMRDFINEVYDSTGLNRKLTHMDMQALLSQAGFPMDSTREHDTISPQQWDEFCAQFRSIVGTLQQVASVWNMEDPVVISGFDMDRVGTITALANEPAGTFICRFSMSQPGCLVLTCKVGPVHPRADAMGLIHAIIKIDDLHERRVDTWIRDYVGATHLLDVYRQKRVDKRKVFATNYTRLRGLEMGEQQPGVGFGQAFM